MFSFAPQSKGTRLLTHVLRFVATMALALLGMCFLGPSVSQASKLLDDCTALAPSPSVSNANAFKRSIQTAGKSAQTAEAPERTTVHPTAIHDVLINPGKGYWIFAGNMVDWSYRVLLNDDGEPLNNEERAKEQAACTSAWRTGKTQIDGEWKPAKWADYSPVVGLGYFRFIWSDFEPSPGAYNWKLIEDAIKPFADAGRQFAFGIVAASSLSSKEYDTPKWVFDAGAKFTEFSIPNGDGTQARKVYPVWTDAAYLARLHEMERAVAERYKNDARIAFVDVRGYGNYGEQHLYNIDPNDDGSYTYAKTEAITSDQLRDLYLKPFADAWAGGTVQVVTCCGEKDYAPAYRWAVDNGIAVRRDGILGGDGTYDGQGNYIYWSDASECAVANGKLPCIFEFAFGGSYASAKERGAWNTSYLNQCVETGQPSYVMLYYDMYRDNKNYLDQLANRMGYWFRIHEATYDARVVKGAPCHIDISFKNDGVAPLFRPNESYVALLSADGAVVERQKTGWDAFAWKPGSKHEETASVVFSGVEPGTYQLAYGLFEKDADETPTYLLGTSGKTDDKWYVLGEVEVIEESELPHHAHRWSSPAYAWASDSSSCAATRSCMDCGEVETETVRSAAEVVRSASCEQAGETVYTATFTREYFAIQTRRQAVPARGHSWDEGVVTKPATATETGVRTFTCLNDPSHTKTEVVPRTAEGGRDDPALVWLEIPASPMTPENPAGPASPAAPATPESPGNPDAPKTSATAASPATPDSPHRPRWIWENGGWHYEDADGARVRGWLWDGTAWYYLSRTGELVSGWLWDNGDWYYLSEVHNGRFGAMVTGWHWDGNWYWLTIDPALQRYGSMARRSWICDRGLWYLTGPDGFIVYGWQWFEGSWWYLSETDGHLYTSARTPDGGLVDSLGRWIA